MKESDLGQRARCFCLIYDVSAPSACVALCSAQLTWL